MKTELMPGGSAAAQARNYIIIICVLLCLGVAASIYFNVKSIDRQEQQVALATARSVYETIVAAREWNARHGGVYVPVNDKMQPNPYLDDPHRDIVTPEVALTKINPAFMTRQIAWMLSSKQGVQIHITSDNPLRPENKPTDWEKKALREFEAGKTESVLIDDGEISPTFRYMAPLKTEQSCLTCHAKQGYKLGDIRGGISVSFAYAPFQNAVRSITMQMFSGYIVFLLIALTVVCVIGRKLVVNISRLQDAMIHIKRLEGLLPICANCKKIRLEGGDDYDQKSWVPVEQYVRDRTDADFTHGICPECIKKLYPEFVMKK